MPVPPDISSLSTNPTSNPPAGTESPTEGDNHLRTIYAFIRQVYDGGINYDPTIAYTSGIGQFLNYTYARTATEVAAGVTPLNYAIAPGNALRYVPAAQAAAILDGTSSFDCTTAIQAFIDAGGGFVPAGKWIINASVGVLLKNGSRITGAGRSRTVFWATLGTGGTQAQLVAYSAGSVFKRGGWSNVGPNQYVSNMYFADFAIVLNHPNASITTTAIQIGLDLRNITRSEVSRVHIGNYAPAGSIAAKADPPQSWAQQGYCFVHGNVASGGGNYAGGEVHSIRDCAAWGGFKLIVQDDTILSPNSAAHGIKVIGCDIQGGHHMLVQESQYSTGIAWQNNTIQNGIKQNGNVSTSYAMRMAGYNNNISGGLYGELSSGADFALRLESSSIGNDVTIGYFSATAGGVISDAGSRNLLQYRASTATLPVVNSSGPLVTMYNRAPLEATYKGHWVGSTETVDSAMGITLSRLGPGDYTINLTTAQPNANWVVDVAGDANASGHMFTFSLVNTSQGMGSIRMFTYGQNGGVSTQLDPRKMYIRVRQAIT